MTTPNQPDRERDARDYAHDVLWGIVREPNPRAELTPTQLDAFDAALEDIAAERDTAWRAAIEGMRKEHGAGCIEDEYGWICVCGGNDWNAALSALADRMGVTGE